MYFDEQEELDRIKSEIEKGKIELVGCMWINKPAKIIGICKEMTCKVILYLVAYESFETEVYTP